MNRHAPIVRVARGAAPVASMPGPALSHGLPDADRRYFETRLQHDFSAVRLHTGAPAAAAAAARGAKAFTDGSDIAFGAGRYQPGTPAGRTLLAHELTHVAQQDRGGSSAGAEHRAQQSASRAALGDTVAVGDQGGAGQGVQCDDDEKKEAPTTLPSFGALNLQLPHLGDGLAHFGAPRLGTSLHTPFAPYAPLAPALIPPPNLFPPLPLSPSGLPPAPGPLTLPQPQPVLTPYGQMKNAEILAPFALHGVTPGMLGLDVYADWRNTLNTFRRYMPEGAAVFSANLALPATYQATLARDYPSAMDKENLRFKNAHPDEFAIPPLPILSSSSLTTLYELITGKSNTQKFYF